MRVSLWAPRGLCLGRCWGAYSMVLDRRWGWFFLVWVSDYERGPPSGGSNVQVEIKYR